MEVNLYGKKGLVINYFDIHIHRWKGALTWGTTWCAILPLFCKTLKSSAPLSLASFFATGYCSETVLVSISHPISFHPPNPLHITWSFDAGSSCGDHQGPRGLFCLSSPKVPRGIDTQPKSYLYKRAKPPPLFSSFSWFWTYQNLAEVLVGNVGKLCTVELGDHELLLAMNRYGYELVSHDILFCAYGMDRDDEWDIYIYTWYSAYWCEFPRASLLRAGDEGRNNSPRGHGSKAGYQGTQRPCRSQKAWMRGCHLLLIQNLSEVSIGRGCQVATIA